MTRRLPILVLGWLLLAVLFAQGVFAATVCQLGDKGDVVHIVQLRLHTLGYLDKKPVSPYQFDASTKAAVKVFQTASDLTSNGVVDDLTYTRLTSSSAVAFEVYEENLKDQQHVLGGSGNFVKTTKARLKALGYLTGAVNVKYDAAAVNAVKYFQLANDLPETGIADRWTRNLLHSNLAITKAEYVASNNLTVVKLGSKGQQVKVLQEQLNALGYLDGPVNTTFSKSTQSAVKLFQKANGLPANGVADEFTRALLNSGKGNSFAAYKSEQMMVQVKSGDSGFAVELLQERLADLRYYSGKASGQYGAPVKAAVVKFQKASGIQATGIASTATRQAMNTEGAVTRIQYEGLLPGDNLPEVGEMTERLKKLRYMKSTTNEYNATVKLAVKKFQQANKLKATGQAAPATLQKMMSADAVSYDEYTNGSSNAKIEKVIDLAMAQLGKPYRTGSACKVPSSFDCSRFTAFVFGKVGVSLPGEVATQGNYAKNRYTKIGSMQELRRGDLVFFDTQPGKKPIGHSAIYLGTVNNNKSFIHASSAAGKVVITPFKDWYQDRFLFGARVWK